MALRKGGNHGVEGHGAAERKEREGVESEKEGT
jgi:hypothetical protein